MTRRAAAAAAALLGAVCLSLAGDSPQPEPASHAAVGGRHLLQLRGDAGHGRHHKPERRDRRAGSPRSSGSGGEGSRRRKKTEGEDDTAGLSKAEARMKRKYDEEVARIQATRKKLIARHGDRLISCENMANKHDPLLCDDTRPKRGVYCKIAECNRELCCEKPSKRKRPKAPRPRNDPRAHPDDSRFEELRARPGERTSSRRHGRGSKQAE
eukprot:TRINITY_DN2706_c0_g1_i1.p2 TRINITY_DN2706_c0_g1~~TRINITY_DN2706_c0_g1_i1.p2  ORF type:complete len:212 (+),score=56.42 TRINITY_DN2706_c0_g1_i1:90-725(+)